MMEVSGLFVDVGPFRGVPRSRGSLARRGGSLAAASTPSTRQRDAIDTVPTQVIKKVGPYIENPDFTPKAIEKASVACKVHTSVPCDAFSTF